MRLFFLLTIFLCLKVHAGAFGPIAINNKAAWDSANHPAILVQNPDSHFPSLPLADNLREGNTLWSDSYWPRNEGGISRRWQDISGKLKYKLLSERQARALPDSEISKLSPSEKFDLLHDDYSFSFTRKIKRQNPLHRPEWEGICHGWALASLHHGQFQPVTLKSKSGKKISFASSDVAALISYYYAWVGGGRVRFLGRRCWQNAGSTSGKCADMNAGAFHIVLTNLIRAKKSFVMDLDPYKHVWNFPVLGYESHVKEEREPKPGSARGTVREILVSTNLFYIHETGPEWFPAARVEGNKNYWYWLELDKNDKIIGGSWTDNNHPDFAWTSAPVKIPSPYSVFIQE